MFKPHIVKKSLDGGALRIGTAWTNLPIAMGMRRHISHNNPAQRPPPCPRCAASLADETGNKQKLEV